MIAVVEPGWASTIQDLGRPGFAHLGVSPAGMVDPGLGTLVNRLVGNPSGAALIETCGGLVLRAERPVLVAHSKGGLIGKQLMLDEHRRDYRALFDRVKLDLGDSSQAVKAMPTDARLKAYSADAPDRVTVQTNDSALVADGTLVITLPPVSWSVIRLRGEQAGGRVGTESEAA